MIKLDKLQKMVDEYKKHGYPVNVDALEVYEELFNNLKEISKKLDL